MRSISQVLAYALHPLFVPIYLFFLFTEIEPVMSLVFSGPTRIRFGISLLVTMVIGPILSIYYMHRQGLVDSFSMPSLKGRSISYGLTACYYALSLMLLWDKALPPVTYAMFIGLIIVLTLLTLISLGYKISAHMTAIGGVVAAVIWLGVQYGLWNVSLLLCLILLAGLLGSTRLYLQAHKPSEVYTGFILGATVIFSSLYYMIA